MIYRGIPIVSSAKLKKLAKQNLPIIIRSEDGYSILFHLRKYGLSVSGMHFSSNFRDINSYDLIIPSSKGIKVANLTERTIKLVEQRWGKLRRLNTPYKEHKRWSCSFSNLACKLMDMRKCQEHTRNEKE